MDNAVAGIIGAAVGVAGSGIVTVFTTLWASKERSADRDAETARSRQQLESETERLRLQFEEERSRWEREREASRTDADETRIRDAKVAAYREVVASAWEWLEAIRSMEPGEPPRTQRVRFMAAFADAVIVGGPEVQEKLRQVRSNLADLNDRKAANPADAFLNHFDFSADSDILDLVEAIRTDSTPLVLERTSLTADALEAGPA